MARLIPHSSHLSLSPPPTPGSSHLEAKSSPIPENPTAIIDARGSPPPGHSAKRASIKGLYARFNRGNPRFINEPISHVTTGEPWNSVQDCFEWSTIEQKCVESGAAKRRSGNCKDKEMFNTSHHCSYPRPQTTSYMLTRKRCQGTTNPIVPNYAVKCQEKISFRHDYNSRLDPCEPPNGKLHGSFVWREILRGPGKVSGSENGH